MDSETKYMVKLMLVFSLVIGFIITGYFVILPTWRDMETVGTEHSYTFVQTKKELLLKLNSDYAKLETQKQQMIMANQQSMVDTYSAQQKAIVDRMKIEAASLSDREVPKEVLPLIK